MSAGNSYLFARHRLHLYLERAGRREARRRIFVEQFHQAVSLNAPFLAELDRETFARVG